MPQLFHLIGRIFQACRFRLSVTPLSHTAARQTHAYKMENRTNAVSSLASLVSFVGGQIVNRISPSN